MDNPDEFVAKMRDVFRVAKEQNKLSDVLASLLEAVAVVVVFVDFTGVARQSGANPAATYNGKSVDALVDDLDELIDARLKLIDAPAPDPSTLS